MQQDKGRILCSAALAVAAAGALSEAASGQSLPLPPGTVVSGTVYNGSVSVPSVTTGADANTLVNGKPPTAPFVNSAPAAAVITDAPTTYVRVYTLGVTAPNRAYIANSDVIRGLDAAQIKNVLALPYLPNMLTVVQVPAGTCLLNATGAPIGGWGIGGTAQSYIIGATKSPTCQNAQYLPASDYTAQQPIGAAALAYLPHAGTGNTAAVAFALDHANPFPAPFSDMDGIYNNLDYWNFVGAAPLQQALAQLDGEIYADTASAAIAANRLFLGAIVDDLQSKAGAIGKPVVWGAALGGAGSLNGDDGSHNVNFAAWGGVLGIDYRFDTALRFGIAGGYTRGQFSTEGVPGDGGYDTFSVAPYLRWAPSALYVEGAVGYGYNDASVNRTIAIPGYPGAQSDVYRTATGTPHANDFLTHIEAGYRYGLTPATSLTPLVAGDAVVYSQGGFTESGAGAANLQASSATTSSVLGILGAQLEQDVGIGLASPLELTARAAWTHEFAPTDRTITASLTGTPGASFTVDGASVPRNAAALGVGASLKTGQAEIFARYFASVGGGQTAQGGALGVRWTF